MGPFKSFSAINSSLTCQGVLYLGSPRQSITQIASCQLTSLILNQFQGVKPYARHMKPRYKVRETSEKHFEPQGPI